MIIMISPYKNVEQFTKIVLEPYQMNSDIRNNLKINLKKKIEKKCNKNGYVDEIYKILSYSDGIMLPENLSGNAIYEVSYHCKLCIPIENSIIIGQVKIINSDLVALTNGPIMMFIPRYNIDSTIWNVGDNFTHKTKKNVKLAVDDFVCVQVLTKRINQNDTQIKIIGKLLDIPTVEDVDTYFGSKIDGSNFI